jgi:hypothetical protein
VRGLKLISSHTSWLDRIAELPSDLKCLRSLTTLNLSSNDLERIDDDLFEGEGEGMSATLATLSLSSNRLDRLPASITALRALTTLSCSHNRIETLPLGFASALGGTLAVLRLAGNQLTSLPDDFGERMLPALQHLDLTDNPGLVSLPFLDDAERSGTTQIFASIPQRAMDNLFIGDMTAGANHASLVHHKITHVLMALQSEPPPYPEVPPLGSTTAAPTQTFKTHATCVCVCACACCSHSRTKWWRSMTTRTRIC